MFRCLPLIVLSTVLAITACKNKDDAAASAPAAGVKEPAAPAAAADKPAAASGSCPAGFTENTIGKFCLKLPTGLSGDGGKGMNVGTNGTQFGYAGSQTGVTIVVAPINEYFADTLAGLAKNCGACKGKVGELQKLGDTGGWIRYENNNGDGRNQISSIIKNDKRTLSCDVVRLASSTNPPSEDDAFDICKTVTLEP